MQKGLKFLGGCGERGFQGLKHFNYAMYEGRLRGGGRGVVLLKNSFCGGGMDSLLIL